MRILSAIGVFGVALILASCDDDAGRSTASTSTRDPVATVASTSSTTPDGTLSTTVPTEQWRFDAGEGYVLVDADERQAVIANGPHYDLDGERGPVIALDATTGDEQWRIDFDCAPFQPLLADDMVLIPCNDGTVFALDREDGSERWRYESGQAPFALVFGDGLVYLDDVDPETYGMGDFSVAHYPDRGRVQALDLATGETRWEFETGYMHTYLSLAGDTLYVGSDDRRGEVPPGGLFALEAATGDLKWETAPGTTRVHGAPAVVGDHVIASGDPVMAFDHDGQQLWQSERSTGGPLSVVGGVILGVESYGTDALFALDPATGQQVWAADWCDCGFHGTVLGDNILVANGAALLLFEIGPTFDLRTGFVWSLVPDPELGTREPAVAAGWLYVGSDWTGTLFAYR